MPHTKDMVAALKQFYERMKEERVEINFFDYI